MKKTAIVIPLALAAAFAVACRAKPADVKLEERNVAIVKSYFALADAGDFDAVARLYEPTTVFYIPSGSVRPVSGAEDTRSARSMPGRSPDLSHRMEELFASGTRSRPGWSPKGRSKRKSRLFRLPASPSRSAPSIFSPSRTGRSSKAGAKSTCWDP